MDADKRAQAIGSAAGWLLIIAGCTAVNGAMQLFHAGWGLALGADALDLVIQLAQGFGAKGIAEAVVVILSTALIGGFYFILSKFAATGKAWPFFVAIAFYGLDTVLSVFAQSWIGIAIHCWALFSLAVGIKAALSKPVYAPISNNPEDNAPQAPPAETI